MAENILKNLNLFVDGRNYAGKVSSLTPPALTILTEDFRPGGRDLPEKVDMGMEALEPSFVLGSYDPEILKLFGWKKGDPVAFVFRGAAQSDDGKVTAIKITMRGRITSIERDTWTPGEMVPLNVTVAANFYQEDINGEVVVEIDGPNMKRVIGGEDQLTDIRNALGF
ncbi:phage major tail tube protein [Endozoicomonas acroporae]|uniref:phage major tail tube protein n=1 Tax=Endozoicomonas acroporae TaxID=1701104 RepID=UPI0013CF7324|nr:phage major tail tube protein [Endozoicomonas acroporae]